ncbi:uncharacterized protein MYCGRDRAFT_86714 [Zymoseptoria tritici IPO323]|uniref:MYND-type domain-containing protein n=1 Tax=Zymoseptoria tritici (strain CBS 115943 / IPO323) TaxID=336722 RepID=F9XGH0_ZYMTI|nr:uncharacterized protein MYCGRDRAFT_86714 [Zymoseptoria tritici IPO323]EGP86268.1 hypothetical protein MYCGRDRAFT_86714 [Zymoseptoria tritici IPO323]
MACSGCRLVVFCDRECQVASWPNHKKHCKSPLIKPSWLPAWTSQNRRPRFMSEAPQAVQTEQREKGKSHFFGNTIAQDVIKLATNEGEDYDKDLNILFAASGDLRHVVQSVIDLPESYTGKVSLYINDKDFAVVARNIIITLIAYKVPDEAIAVECILHIWYSAFLTPEAASAMRLLSPLFAGVLDRLKVQGPEDLLSTEWTLGSSTCEVVLRKRQWQVMPLFTSITSPTEDLRKARTDTTLAPTLLDDRHRRMFVLRPTDRVCWDRFRQDGILLPFGHSREEFEIVNPTLFVGSRWLLHDEDDPLNGWDWGEIMRTDSGPATNDLYGKLYFLLSEKLARFVRRIRSGPFHFHFHSRDAAILPKVFTNIRFARIETSNIVDEYYLGTRSTVWLLGGLLEEVAQNPHATLVTLYMNAIDAVAGIKSEDDPEWIRFQTQAEHFKKSEKWFDLYKKAIQMSELERISTKVIPGGVVIKEVNTVVEKWPGKLKLSADKVEVQKEFDVIKHSNQRGVVRYVEWKRGSKC